MLCPIKDTCEVEMFCSVWKKAESCILLQYQEQDTARNNPQENNEGKE